MAAIITCSLHHDVDQVLFEESSAVRKVILNRPKKLNPLNYEMISKISRAVETYEHDPAVGCVVLKANGKAFSAGGDVLSVICSLGGHWSFPLHYYRKLLEVCHLLSTFKKPVVSLFHGLVMGAGAGLTLPTTFQIVTEKTVNFSPISFHFISDALTNCNVAYTTTTTTSRSLPCRRHPSGCIPTSELHIFSRVSQASSSMVLPCTTTSTTGEYLALTGARVDGPEMVACGLASHFVPSKDLHRLEEAMCEGVLPSSAASTIAEIISRFAHTPGVKQDSALNRLETVIKRCFSGSTVEEIMSSLENEAAKTGAADKWIKEAYNSMKSASPTSLKVTLRSIREGRKQSLHQCLSREFLISIHMVRGISTRDFYEGCRGMFLEKENRPQWDPPSLELVTEEMVDKFFQEIDDPETGGPLRIPQRSGSSLLAKL
ncbi:hypothetical protein SAY86_025285 [Trapa natans]|uniref:3-hydroxyisobutyryl-CoA hydrolase n=1 Tax=Trapa natans TaxID=22666 RepID=A0AAN7M5Z2_TRANT|nr:hypothetical protein SAY86_025285 [Trapa natans]